VDKVVVWHYAADGRTYHNTKTQVSADGTNWTTVYDSAVSGEYPETAAGKTHSFSLRNVRYVRDWVNGSTSNTGNHWVEIQVWGQRSVTYIGNYLEWTGATNTMKKYYYAGATRVAMRQGSSLYYLLGDHLGSTSLVTDPGGVILSATRYDPWGELRAVSGPSQTSYGYTGQRAEKGLGLYFYGARFYDPQLGRWIQPDTIVPGSQGVQALDRYAYVNNNAVRYTDPTGHWMCDSYDESCAENSQETAQFQIMAAGLQPASSCSNDPLCSDSYDTFVAVTATLGYVPSMSEILYMTAGTEYYSYNGYSGVRATGQEGLARNYYEACGTDGCNGNELYKFFAGFQPWYGRPYVMGDGSASARAAYLINNGLRNDFFGTGDALWSDVGQILDLDYASNSSRLWTEGAMSGRPWQWYGPFPLDPARSPSFGYDPGNTAILSVDLGNGNVFWMFTFYQDWAFNLDFWSLP